MRFPQGIIIDPRKVLPSRHSIFIRGFPHTVKIEDIKEVFSKQCDGKCRIDFFSYSEDKSYLFVAIRFDSHNVARKMLMKYDGERILGHKIEISWFKDIRKARKKVIENEQKYQALLARPQSDYRRYTSGRCPSRRITSRRFFPVLPRRFYGQPQFRQCVSSSDSSRSRSRSTFLSKKENSSRKRRSSSVNHSLSSSISGDLHPRSPAMSIPRRTTDSSPSTSRRSSTSSQRRSMSKNKYDEKIEQIFTKESANTAYRSASSSADESYTDRWRPLSSASSSVKSEHHGASIAWNCFSVAPVNADPSPKHKTSKQKRRKLKKRRHKEHSNDRYRTPDEDWKAQPNNTIKRSPSRMRSSEDSDKQFLEDEPDKLIPEEIVDLEMIHLPDEQTSPAPGSIPETQQETMPSVSRELNESEDITNDEPRNQTPPSLESSSFVKNDGKHSDSQPTSDVGVQASFALAEALSLDDGYVQLAFLTETKVDEIFYKKRMIEAAYRLDCESYTSSISKLIRMNPDLKDRLLISLRNLLEERAKRSISELQEYIRNIRR